MKKKKRVAPKKVESEKDDSQFSAIKHWIENNPRPFKLIIVDCVLLIILVLMMILMPQKESGIYQPKILTSRQTQEAPTEIPRKIDGLVVKTEEANPIPVCVMIENAAFGGVRPQAGLSQASVVYEVVVEGGITRFMAVFANNTEDRVGPVRSARDTYLEFASEYDCAYVHAGGSFTAMQAIPRFGMRDIDALREAQYFTRRSDKQPVHNLYTTLKDLHQSVEEHSWNKLAAPNYASWRFDSEVERLTVEDLTNEDGTVRTLSVSILFGGSYNVEWTYNPETGLYQRVNGGLAHTDENTGEQLTAHNVIVQTVGPGTEIEGKGRINWPVTGEGNATIFVGGVAHEGTWRKADRQSRTVFYNTNGEEITLLPGNSWVEVVPEHISVENTH